jgi:hypothetical protein
MFNGRSNYSEKIHPLIKTILATNPGFFKGKCAEVDALSDAFRIYTKATAKEITTVTQSREVLKNSNIQSANVRATSTKHGAPQDPCERACKLLLDTLGVIYY